MGRAGTVPPLGKEMYACRVFSTLPRLYALFNADCEYFALTRSHTWFRAISIPPRATALDRLRRRILAGMEGEERTRRLLATGPGEQERCSRNESIARGGAWPQAPEHQQGIAPSTSAVGVAAPAARSGRVAAPPRCAAMRIVAALRPA